MSSAIAVPSLPPPPGPPGFYRLTVYQYEQMAGLGILTEDDKVELLGEALVGKMTKAESHTASCTDTRDALLKLICMGWYLPSRHRSGSPTTTSPNQTWRSFATRTGTMSL